MGQIERKVKPNQMRLASGAGNLMEINALNHNQVLIQLMKLSATSQLAPSFSEDIWHPVPLQMGRPRK